MRSPTKEVILEVVMSNFGGRVSFLAFMTSLGGNSRLSPFFNYLTPCPFWEFIPSTAPHVRCPSTWHGREVSTLLCGSFGFLFPLPLEIPLQLFKKFNIGCHEFSYSWEGFLLHRLFLSLLGIPLTILIGVLWEVTYTFLFPIDDDQCGDKKCLNDANELACMLLGHM